MGPSARTSLVLYVELSVEICVKAYNLCRQPCALFLNRSASDGAILRKI